MEEPGVVQNLNNDVLVTIAASAFSVRSSRKREKKRTAIGTVRARAIGGVNRVFLRKPQCHNSDALDVMLQVRPTNSSAQFHCVLFTSVLCQAVQSPVPILQRSELGVA